MDALAALVPPIGVGILFYVAMRSMINADRRERAALADMERAEGAAVEGSPRGAASADKERANDPGHQRGSAA